MWKPIVTAPKDGSFVLICDTEDPSELMIIARWRFGAWRSKPTPSGKSIVWMDATHWMPLPEMPNALSSAAAVGGRLRRTVRAEKWLAMYLAD